MESGGAAIEGSEAGSVAGGQGGQVGGADVTGGGLLESFDKCMKALN